MNPKRKSRLTLVLLILAGVGAAVTLGLKALDENLLYYFLPSQIKAGEAPIDHSFRLGGLVGNNSVQREKDGLTTHFDVVDVNGVDKITVSYTGILPDLFREGQGIVATGKLTGQTKNGNEHFVASEVLAKHDENYMPPVVKEAMEKAHVEGVKNMQAGAQATASSAPAGSYGNYNTEAKGENIQ
jgi:cytochrome c-type biogenesis protein CcmE